MPYKSISELPESVRKNLPKSAARIWMAAFNFSYRKYSGWDEGDRAQYAWGAVKRRFKQDGSGSWSKLSMEDSFITEDDQHILSADDLLDAAEYVIKLLNRVNQNT